MLKEPPVHFVVLTEPPSHFVIVLTEPPSHFVLTEPPSHLCRLAASALRVGCASLGVLAETPLHGMATSLQTALIVHGYAREPPLREYWEI